MFSTALSTTPSTTLGGFSLPYPAARSVLLVRGRLISILVFFLTNPYITIATAAKVLKIAAPTATRLIRELEAKGLLRETTGKKWGKIYVAPGVLAALEQRTTI
jgi:predicted transcriptional regulator